MICREFESLTGSYLNGSIPEEKREMFEEHYFICDSCYASLVVAENLYNKKVRIVPREGKRFSVVFKPAVLFVSFIFIIFASLFITDLTKKKEALFEISSFVPPLYIKGENRGESTPQSFYDAMEYYIKEDYEKAYTVIRSIETGNPQSWYFRGILALLNGRNDDALEQFNLIISAMSPSYYDEAVYYRGICYLRMNRKKDAEREFANLESMFSPLSRKASEKLKMISEL